MQGQDRAPSLGRVALWAVAGVLALVALGVAFAFLRSGAATVTQDARVNTANRATPAVIANYERFFDYRAQYRARLAQVGEFRGRLPGAEGPGERYRLETELSAVRASCRELAERYNEDSLKTYTVAGFKDRDLPQTLDAAACER